MPIYMDRHDIPGATAEHVANAHQLDLEIQDKYNCRGLTYWFDDKSCMAFCLIHAPDKDSVLQMHKDSHGLIPGEIIEVEEKLVNAFLGRITDPNPQTDLNFTENFINEGGFRTILYLETKQPILFAIRDKDLLRKIINIQHDVVNKAVKENKGSEIKDLEEGFMASFTSLSNAIKCGVDIQTAFINYNSDKTSEKISASIGITSGGPVTKKYELFGEAIELAKRICKIAGKDEIILSTSTRDIHIENKLNLANLGISIKFLEPSDEKFLGQLFDATEKVWDKMDFNISDFSRMIGLSKSQLNRKTTALSGYSPNEFIKEYKLLKALKLLEKQKGNVTEIAYDTGFSNASYFSKCFQKRFGILPSKLS